MHDKYQECGLETPRCILRKYVETDVEPCFEILKEYPEITKFLRFSPPTEKEETLENFRQSSPDDAHFAILFEGKFIGRCGLHGLFIPNSQVEFGFWISPEFHGRGLGTEILQEVCRFAFFDLDIPEIFSGAFAENEASIRVHQKVGFKTIRSTKNTIKKNGIFVEHIDFCLRKTDFHPPK